MIRALKPPGGRRRAAPCRHGHRPRGTVLRQGPAPAERRSSPPPSGTSPETAAGAPLLPRSPRGKSRRDAAGAAVLLPVQGRAAARCARHPRPARRCSPAPLPGRGWSSSTGSWNASAGDVRKPRSSACLPCCSSRTSATTPPCVSGWRTRYFPGPQGVRRRRSRCTGERDSPHRHRPGPEGNRDHRVPQRAGDLLAAEPLPPGRGRRSGVAGLTACADDRWPQ